MEPGARDGDLFRLDVVGGIVDVVRQVQDNVGVVDVSRLVGAGGSAGHARPASSPMPIAFALRPGRCVHRIEDTPQALELPL